MKHTLYILLLAPLFAAVTACSSDDFAYEGAKDEVPSNIVTFSGYGSGWDNGRPGTRAAAPADVNSCTPLNPMSIGVWGYYQAAGAPALSSINAVGMPIPNDYKVYDVKNSTTTYNGNIPDTSTPYYQTLSDYRFPYAPEATTHLDFVTQQYHYGVGEDQLGQQDGGFPWEDTQYMFYCYAPHRSDIKESTVTARLLSKTSPLTEYTGGSPSDDIKYIELSGLPSITNRDIVIAQQRRQWSRLSASGYEHNYGPCVDFHSEGYQLQHLYAAVQFCFALDEKYAELRYLHIKSVAVTTDEAFKDDGNSQLATYTITKDITSKDGALSSPAEARSAGTPQTTIIGEWTANNQFLLGVKGAAINDPGKLEATYKPGDAIPYVSDSEKYYAFGNLYVWPQQNRDRTGISTYDTKPKRFAITVTYDVYDRTGHKTREDATASSVLTFPNDAGDGSFANFQAGHYYNAYIKINPDFLYVLSDDDASADIIIEGSK